MVTLQSFVKYRQFLLTSQLLSNLSDLWQMHRSSDSEEWGLRTHTEDLFMGEAHDVHRFHGLLEVILVLLPRDRDIAIGEEPVVVETFQE